MALKKIEIAVPTAAPSKSKLPTFRIPGRLISRYDAADRKAKDADAELKEIRPDVVDKALGYLIAHNLQNPHEPVDSIRLEDDALSDLRFSFTSKYKIVDGNAADAKFAAAGIDINEFAQETISASFDSSVFLDKNGDFDQQAFAMFNLAIAEVAKKLGKTNPLSAKKVVLPKPTLHAQRWEKFNTPALQRLLTEALPNTHMVVAGTLQAQ